MVKFLQMGVFMYNSVVVLFKKILQEIISYLSSLGADSKIVIEKDSIVIETDDYEITIKERRKGAIEDLTKKP
tara:strand:+ start:40332 stop:40550 length:219 start_codon:yes stop_codon:yes gene_type:complete